MIYEFNDYQNYLKNYVETQKKLGNSITYQQLADSMRMQKSYFSKIMAGNANLNLEQGYLLAKKLKLSLEEKEYLYLLIEHQRVSLKELQEELKKKIQQAQTQKTQTAEYIEQNRSLDLAQTEIQKYYLFAETQLIHLGLSIPKFQKDPSSLIKLLNISHRQFEDTIKTLRELKLIDVQGDKIKILKSGLYLPPDSPFFPQWSTQFKLKGIEQLKLLEDKDKYSFTASFSGSDEDKEQIKLEYLKLLKRIEKIVKKSKAKHLYQIQFDLFKWF